MASTAFAGTGTKADPYTVKDLLDKGTPQSAVADIYVIGYIVGSVEGMTYNTAGVHFGTENASGTNIVIAGSDAEDDINYCMPVALPSGNVRNALNLAANPDNLGHQIIMKGSWEKYFGVNGIKNVSEFQWVGDAPAAGGGNTGNYATGTPDAPLTVTEFLAQGTPAAAVAGTYLTGYIVGYINTEGNANEWVFSATDCNNATNIIVAAAANVTDKAQTVAVQLPAGDVRSALNLVDNAGNLGKQVTLYGSHEAYFSTNGLKNVTNYWWGAKGEAVENPGQPGDQPAAPTGEISVAKALEYIIGGGTGTITVKGYVTKVDTETSDPEKYGDINYYISDDTNGTNELYIYNGYYLGGEKFTSTDQLKAGDLVVVEGKGKMYNGTAELDRGSKIISLNGETAGPGTGGGNEGPVNPGDYKGTVQLFDKGLGFPEGSANASATATKYTASDTGISYEIMGCYVNSGYIMLNGKNYEGAYISWTLDTPMKVLVMTTSGVCSTNEASQVNVYANGNAIAEGLKVNAQNATYAIEIPEAYQAAGTVYKVESATTKYNQQFASFLYANGENGVEEILAADDSEAVYFNLQGQKVANPEHGIFVKVVNGKALKVVK